MIAHPTQSNPTSVEPEPMKFKMAQPPVNHEVQRSFPDCPSATRFVDALKEIK